MAKINEKKNRKKIAEIQFPCKIRREFRGFNPRQILGGKIVRERGKINPIYSSATIFMENNPRWKLRRNIFKSVKYLGTPSLGRNLMVLKRNWNWVCLNADDRSLTIVLKSSYSQSMTFWCRGVCQCLFVCMTVCMSVSVCVFIGVSVCVCVCLTEYVHICSKNRHHTSIFQGSKIIFCTISNTYLGIFTD